MLPRGCCAAGIQSGPKSIVVVHDVERGKLVAAPLGASPTARQADGAAGARRLTKQMPFCNGEDTELSPARKGAKFWRVLDRERIWRIFFHGGTANDGR